MSSCWLAVSRGGKVSGLWTRNKVKRRENALELVSIARKDSQQRRNRCVGACLRFPVVSERNDENFEMKTVGRRRTATRRGESPRLEPK